MGKKLFFDIDGTLVSFKTHNIPESTINALREAKERGAGIYIATGRPVCLMTNIGGVKDLVDGYLTTNGAHCFIGEDTIVCEELKREDVDIMMEDALRNDYAVLFSCEKNICIFNNKPCVKTIFTGELAIDGLDSLPSCEETFAGQKVLQATAFCTAEQEMKLMSRLGGCVSGRWHPGFIDITSAAAGKGRGLAAMMDFMGVDISDAVAFGDGGNDISLLKAAGLGIAMGNSGDDVKAAADYVTASVDEDGIARALRHFGII